MRILAVDTSTEVGAVGFLDTDSGAAGETNLAVSQTHSQRLLSSIDHLLNMLACGLSEIDVLGVSIGPGSFTGLRIGISIMQGLAMAQDRMLTPFSSLEALANNYAGSPHLVCPMIDARMGEVFTALFSFDGDKLLLEAHERAAPPDEIVRLASERETIFLGDGANLYAQTIANGMRAKYIIAPSHLSQPRGICAARIVAQTARERGGVDPSKIRPKYLRKSNAELTRDSNMDAGSISPT